MLTYNTAALKQTLRDLGQFRVKAEKTKRAFMYDSGKLSQRLAEQFCVLLRQNLQSQKYFGGKGLSTSWKKKKKAKGWNESVGIATGVMLENLSIFRTTDRTGWEVGIKGNVFNPVSGLGGKSRVAEYAAIFETVRPFIAPSLAEFMEQEFPNLVNEYQRQIERIWK